MTKIWIIRERMDWHNTDPDDITTAFATKAQARKELTKRYNEVKTMIESSYGLESEMTKKTVNSGTLVTSRDDYYNIWIEEIDFN